MSSVAEECLKELKNQATKLRQCAEVFEEETMVDGILYMIEQAKQVFERQKEHRS